MKETHKYDDIIGLPHHVSAKRAPMSLVDRGAQFSPFAALTGFDAAIAETARRTDDPIDLADGGKAMVDEKLRRLLEMEGAGVSVTYFRPDSRKAGGAYVSHAGRVKKVDAYAQALVLTDGTAVPFDAILDIDIEQEDSYGNDSQTSTSR